MANKAYSDKGDRKSDSGYKPNGDKDTKNPANTKEPDHSGPKEGEAKAPQGGDQSGK